MEDAERADEEPFAFFNPLWEIFKRTEGQINLAASGKLERKVLQEEEHPINLICDQVRKRQKLQVRAFPIPRNSRHESGRHNRSPS